ncbi:hypothetical protein STRAU_3148 [Streptomyces aurantiacus JA 4570]|uniref:Uncharacterized protein n=1 Tax=Streptomyces aurantiacus JA 4570 TaxID=1286094 RepID=S3ZZ77_9ACTN|nr:hypothetical protein STRAU_3148 [Streptomyces aurantiacus JA 4570]
MRTRRQWSRDASGGGSPVTSRSYWIVGSGGGLRVNVATTGGADHRKWIWGCAACARGARWGVGRGLLRVHLAG